MNHGNRWLWLGLASGVLFQGCVAEGDLHSEEALEKIEALYDGESLDSAPSEGQLLDDERYMEGVFLERGNGSWVDVDLTDSRQFRYLINRLRSNHVTPTNSPQLYLALAESHQKAAEGKTTSTTSSTFNPDLFGHLVYISGYQTFQTGTVPGTNQQAKTNSQYSTSADNGIQDGTWYTYLDNTVYKVDGTTTTKVGSKYVEEYEDGRNVSVPLSVTIGTGYSVKISSLSIQYRLDGSTVQTAAYDNSDKACPSNDIATVTEHPINNPYDIDPYNVESSTSDIFQCLDRCSTDCDYVFPAPVNNHIWVEAHDYCEALQVAQGANSALPIDHLYLRMKGSLTCRSVPASSNLSVVASESVVWLSLTDLGGICMTDCDSDGKCASKPLEASYCSVDSSAGACWDKNPVAGSVNGMVPGDFGPYCFNEEPQALLNVKAKLLDSVTGKKTSITKLYTTPIGFKWSCFARGTQIRMAGGNTIPIDAIEVGDEVLTDDSGDTMTVIDRTLGTEQIPMVRIWDSLGHSLLVTQGHPIVTDNDGVLRADELEIGDVLITEQGLGEVSRIDREMTLDPIYNLTLAHSGEEPSGATVWADGILAGDQRMQHQLRPRRQFRPPLPNAWQADKGFDSARWSGLR